MGQLFPTASPRMRGHRGMGNARRCWAICLEPMSNYLILVLVMILKMMTMETIVIRDIDDADDADDDDDDGDDSSN